MNLIRVAAFCAGFTLLFVSCRSRSMSPEPGSPEYQTAVATFYSGLAALQVGHDIYADTKLSEFTRLAPTEPAGWANWAVLAIRQRNFELAANRLRKANERFSDNDQIQLLHGVLESERGRNAEAIAAFRRAVALNPKNLRALYRLAEELERAGTDQAIAEAQALVQKILVVEPENLAAKLEFGRLAAKRGDTTSLRVAIEGVVARSAAWPPEVRKQVATLQSSSKQSDLRAVGRQLAFVRNVLMRVPEFRSSLNVIKAPPGEEVQPLTQFLVLASPKFKPATPDRTLTFRPQTALSVPAGQWGWVGVLSLDDEASLTIAVANGRELRLATGSSMAFPATKSDLPSRTEAVVTADLNYDFRNDLVLTGSDGVRLVRQENRSSFRDVTGESKLSKAVLQGSYSGAWPVDIEADGDLDIVLGTRVGPTLVLRNNGDGTFAPTQPFSGLSGLSQFAWADFDGDGDPDVAAIDHMHRLRVFANERIGQFNERTVPSDLPHIKAIAAADLDSDSLLDLVLVASDGKVLRVSDQDEGGSWHQVEIARTSLLDPKAEVRLISADFDNNGAVDLAISQSLPTAGRRSQILLQDEAGAFAAAEAHVDAQIFAAGDVNNDGKIDLLGLNAAGQPTQFVNSGTRSYHWQVVRLRAVQATGDQRVNPFGIGSEVEIRSGLLLQKQAAVGQALHFGLGEQTSADVVRVVWPNGSVSAEFDVKADQQILTEQRLKGSCPFLFAFDGKQMRFVKDSVPWGSAIGLRINTLGTARVEATTEWFKIGREELVARDGFYDLRVTAELWETYYYDQLSLMAVDHPPGTEIFVDERFVIPPVKLAITAVETPRRIARATDDNGNDVTDLVSTFDDKYLDTFDRGQYQGVTRDHYVEVDLGSDAPSDGPLWLIAKGWMHPTDSSINVALSQGSKYRAQALSLEVPDGKGGWTVAKPNLGFPAGRKKISLIELTGLFRPGVPRKLRLRTNLEIYWDSLEWARGIPAAPVKITHLDPDVADLRFRGFSRISRADPSSPELPDYNQLEGSKQRWRDLIGYYTRFGGVRELLKKADDRYVIMNAGDEMSLRFAEPPPPAQGWVRDFVIVGDGWIKDGDYNSTFSKTVLPLPYHGKKVYDTPSLGLEQERVYRRFPEDWQTYHTRYITPEAFRNSLRTEVTK